jgi:hypothetical protein
VSLWQLLLATTNNDVYCKSTKLTKTIEPINMKYPDLSYEEEKIGKSLVNASYNLHKALGPGLLERVYEVCLAHELKKAGIRLGDK